MSRKLLSPWPSYADDEIEAVNKVLLSNKVNYWTGEEGRLFEKEFAAFSECLYAVAVSNGTVALELALQALGIKEGDEVIVTPRTFIACASSIVLCGGIPVFADVDKNTQTITAETIRKVITDKTKVIITVHLAGCPCDMDPIMELAKDKNIAVLEDCAQAHGAKYKGKSVGSLGHIAAWSFCQDKIITTAGEGGMITTSNEELFQTIWSLKDHGKSYGHEPKADENTTSEFLWLHDSFGTNRRLTEVQSAIGRVQIRKLSEWHRKRTDNAMKILASCRKFPSLMRVPEIPDYMEHAWYKCYVFIKTENLPGNWNRGEIIKAINKLGVPCYSGTCPEIYKERAFDNTLFRPNKDLPVAKRLGETSIMLLVHPTLTAGDVNKICASIETIMGQIAEMS